MPRKPKFRPRITRVKLNPEQAVLACNCYNAGTGGSVAGTAHFYPDAGAFACISAGKSRLSPGVASVVLCLQIGANAAAS